VPPPPPLRVADISWLVVIRARAVTHVEERGRLCKADIRQTGLAAVMFNRYCARLIHIDPADHTVIHLLVLRAWVDLDVRSAPGQTVHVVDTGGGCKGRLRARALEQCIQHIPRKAARGSGGTEPLIEHFPFESHGILYFATNARRRIGSSEERSESRAS
jgi:hypothetical protein